MGELEEMVEDKVELKKPKNGIFKREDWSWQWDGNNGEWNDYIGCHHF